MALWVDKYRPNSLEKLSYHSELTLHLKNLASSGDFPHLLLYGPSGAGKKTRIVSILRELFGASAEKIKVEQRQYVTPSNRKLELNIVSSNYHLEVNPSDLGNQDVMVIQNLVKETAQTQQVDASAKKRFKVIVINEADSLSKLAQQALRRTMEKYMSNLRIILCCNSTSKIIDPIRSRCLLVRVAAPKEGEIISILSQIASKERLDVSQVKLAEIATAAKGNVRKALLLLETAHVQKALSDRSPLAITDWEVFISQIANLMIAEQTPERIMEVREKLYELLTHCIPASIIIKTLSFALVSQVDQTLKPDIIHAAALYEHRIRIGSKAIFHLEAFVAKFMSLYKKYLIEVYG